MSKYKTEVMVGVFVMLTIGALLLLALKVANQTVATEGDTYTLYAKFDNIGGLKPRSAVKVGGVTVGRVSSITLDQEDFTPVVGPVSVLPRGGSRISALAVFPSPIEATQ